MITSLHLRNFKRFESLDVSGFKPVNLIATQTSQTVSPRRNTYEKTRARGTGVQSYACAGRITRHPASCGHARHGCAQRSKHDCASAKNVVRAAEIHSAQLIPRAVMTFWIFGVNKINYLRDYVSNLGRMTVNSRGSRLKFLGNKLGHEFRFTGRCVMSVRRKTIRQVCVLRLRSRVLSPQ